MLNSTYKQIPDYPIYYASPTGEISNGRIVMKTYIINSGYACLKFTINGVRSSHLVHRLIAQTFLPNPDNKTEVNHIDGNKLNNNVSNLEWVTSSENKVHARDTGLSVYNVPTLGVKKGKGSKYRNVSWDKSRSKWIGAIRHNKKTYFQRRFNSEEEAALHVNWIIDELGLTDRPYNIIS